MATAAAATAKPDSDGLFISGAESRRRPVDTSITTALYTVSEKKRPP